LLGTYFFSALESKIKKGKQQKRGIKKMKKTTRKDIVTVEDLTPTGWAYKHPKYGALYIDYDISKHNKLKKWFVFWAWDYDQEFSVTDPITPEEVDAEFDTVEECVKWANKRLKEIEEKNKV